MDAQVFTLSMKFEMNLKWTLVPSLRKKSSWLLSCRTRGFDGFIIIMDNCDPPLELRVRSDLTASHPSPSCLCPSWLPPPPPTSPSSPLLSTQSAAMSYFKRPFTLSYLSAHPWRSEAGWHQRLAGGGRHIYLAVTACGKRDCWRLHRSSKNIDLVWKKVCVLCVVYQILAFSADISLKSSFCHTTCGCMHHIYLGVLFFTVCAQGMTKCVCSM